MSKKEVELEGASIEAWHALSMQLWELLQWIAMLCATEATEEYQHKLMNSPAVIRMIEHAITGDTNSDIKPPSVHVMHKIWTAWSLAPSAVQETLAPLMSMYKREVYTPQGLGPNELWIDDDGQVMYPEPPSSPPPPPGAQTQTKYPFQNHLPVTAEDMAAANAALMYPHGPEFFYS
jgi:hypothetical protein